MSRTGRLTAVKLADDGSGEDYTSHHIKFRMPFFITDRSFLTTLYTEECEDGTLIAIQSS